jgi:poly(hydroxyalkanoate) depolymerase family esterase
MPSLAETTALLAHLKRQTAEAARAVSPGDDSLVETDFAPNPGALRMLSYVPSTLGPRAPLVVALHGCTQTAAAYARTAGWLTLADRCGFAVLAPEQSTSNNPNRCFNWFDPKDARRDDGEAASIRAMVAHAVREHGLDPRRVFVTGLSAGGAMTAALLASYPDVFAGGAIIAGLPYGVAETMQSALMAMYSAQARSAAELGDLVRRAGPGTARPPRVSIWHGDADAMVKVSNAGESEKQWTAVHGLPAAPSRTEDLPGRRRLSWLSPETGQVLVESNILHGMGHGTPLATQGPEGLGAVAPFMLEAGVSSTLEIARFWGIDQPASATVTNGPGPAHSGPETNAQPRRAFVKLGDQVMASVAQHAPVDVNAVITRALKAAGLKR